MIIVVDTISRIVKFAGVIDVTGEMTNWCDKYQISDFTTYAGVTLPEGYLDNGWTYSGGVWAILPAKEALVAEQIAREQTVLTGLQIQGGGAVFNGRDCRLEWTAPATARIIDHYTVNIYSGGVLRRSEPVTTPAYTYTFGKNFDDHAGAPVPSFTVQVTAVDIGHGEGTPAVLEVANSVPSAPTALIGSGELMSNRLTLVYPAPEDFAEVEIWSGSSNNRQVATLAGTTKTGEFLHTGLPPASSRWYWARVKDLFNQYSSWYPLAGVQVVSLADPSDVLKLLNADISDQRLQDYFNGSTSILELFDTRNIVTMDGVVADGVFANWTNAILAADRNSVQARVDVIAATTRIEELEGQILLTATAEIVDGLRVDLNAAQVDINALTDEITLRATQVSVDTLTGTVSDMTGEISVMSDAIGLKLDAGPLSAGLLISWTDNTHTRSNITAYSDTFRICMPDGTGARHVLTTGMINGVATIGISGDLVLDGTFLARHIAANQLVVGDNVAMGPNASISWSNVSDGPNTNYIDANGVYTGDIAWSNVSGRPNTTYIDANGIYTGTVSAGKITGGTIAAGVSITSPTINGGTIIGSTLRTATDTEAHFIVDTSNAARFINAEGHTIAYFGAVKSFAASDPDVPSATHLFVKSEPLAGGGMANAAAFKGNVDTGSLWVHGAWNGSLPDGFGALTVARGGADGHITFSDYGAGGLPPLSTSWEGTMLYHNYSGDAFTSLFLAARRNSDGKVKWCRLAMNVVDGPWDY